MHVPWRSWAVGLILLGTTGCAPTLARIRDSAWTPHQLLDGAVQFELPATRDPHALDLGGFEGAFGGFPMHAEGASYDERGNGPGDTGVVALVMAVQLTDALCPAPDAAALAATRVGLASVPQGAKVERFEPQRLSGLPGWRAELTYWDDRAGQLRVIIQVVEGEKTIYVLTTGFIDAPVFAGPGRAIADHLARSFSASDRPPARATPGGMPVLGASELVRSLQKVFPVGAQLL